LFIASTFAVDTMKTMFGMFMWLFLWVIMDKILECTALEQRPT
jgi:hypothetical protein